MNLNSEDEWLSEPTAKVIRKVKTSVFLYQRTMTLENLTHTVLFTAHVGCRVFASWNRCFSFLLTSVQIKTQVQLIQQYYVGFICFAILLGCTF